MSSTVETPCVAERPPPVSVHRFTVDQYHRLGELGILVEDDRVELLAGWIVPKMVHNPQHDAAIQLLDEAIRRLLPNGWRLRIQSSLTTADSEPEPDLAVVRGPARGYLSRHPSAEDTALVIEVADSSLARDRGTKLRVYAGARIETYWIVNLVARQVEVHREPSGGEPEPIFRSCRVYSVGEKVPLLIDGRVLAEILVEDILP
ncbi:MAG: Uma2 family endonuclease [Planctomycetes bacterium]|nr:Uma2 family endonuclease [Planctomycetota bacterium]